MATHSLQISKDGRRFYRIFVYAGADKPRYSTTWTAPDGWAQKSIERELKKVESAFETDCKAGRVESRKERAENKIAAEARAADIQTLREYGEKVFMPSKTILCAEKTRQFYQFMLDKHIYPALGDNKLPEITPAQITAFLLHEHSSGVSASTMNGIYITTGQLFKMAYRADLIDRNPMEKVSKPRAGKVDGGAREIKFFTEEEAAYILRCTESEPLKWRVYLQIAIETGCRNGEILGVKWNCINFDNLSIEIRNNLCYTPQKGVYEDTPKTGHFRTVFITPKCAALLQDLRAETISANKRREKRLIKDNQPLDFDKIRFSEFVFTEKGSAAPMHPQSPNRYLKKFGQRYGIEDFHPHKLRHTFASIAIMNGADIASVSEMLGHADKATTLKMYTHADEAARRRASEIMINAVNEKMAAK